MIVGNPPHFCYTGPYDFRAYDYFFDHIDQDVKIVVLQGCSPGPTTSIDIDPLYLSCLPGIDDIPDIVNPHASAGAQCVAHLRGRQGRKGARY